MSGPLAYRDFFDEVRAGAHQGIDMPWDDDKAHTFWRELCTRSVEDVLPHIVPRQAARHLVPVHARGAAPSKDKWKLSHHYFLYPFGVGFLLHAEYPHPDTDPSTDVRLPLDDVVEACYDLRGDDSSEESWARFIQRSAAHASDVMGGVQLDLESALTVVTFMKVDDVLGLERAERDRVLNALTGWPERDKWGTVKPEDSPRIDLSARHNVEGRHVHAARRGRSLWFPDGFSGEGALSDDHRRLCFMTMQTEMLIRFMEETARRLPSLPSVWDLWASRGARMIGLLYGDDRIKAWDSSSPRVQIDQSKLVPAINQVRAHYSRPGRELPPLHP